ncbi:hypothetical protein SAY86_026413 [Trapa natans]|uniref:DUF7734 domain-containing protein n=1 Tax=Trapa natans TaxID=22666 RepID=A0AAN7KII0_TRANT|nr:hypothetical protein SAY86_026413 [Trapa natans]
MLKLHLRRTISLELFFLLPKSPSPSPPHSIAATRAHPSIASQAWPISMKLGGLTATTRPVLCFARRRSVRYGAEDGGDEEVEEGEDGYGDNAEIGLLELYSQSAKGEALIVHADIDGDQVEVLIFKVSSRYAPGKTYKIVLFVNNLVITNQYPLTSE